MIDQLSLNGAGGITRRMTDKEELAELTKKYNNLREGVEGFIAQGLNAKDLTAEEKIITNLIVGILQQLLKEDTK